MDGIPENLDLRPFQGDYLTQLGIGKYDLQLRFGAGGVISVHGHWELRDAAGTLLDKATGDPARWECFRLAILLEETVSGTRVDSPRSFTLLFANGMSFTIFDDDQHYETCSIQPGNVFI